MKTFLSIIYIPLNPTLDEKVSIGLIMFNNDKAFFKISETKLHAIKNLLPAQNYNILKIYFKSLEKEINQEIKDNIFKLDIANKKTEWIKESYMTYLHRYANNLVSFSEVKQIEISLNEQNFKNIFEKYIFQYVEHIEELETSFEDKVVSSLFPKIENKVNIQKTITPKIFHELITPVTVDFIGKNGTIVAGQTMDFSKRLYNLENDLNKYITFTKAADFKDKNKGHYFVIGQEPSKQQVRNHNTWAYVKNNNLVDYVDFSEIDKIKSYIDDKGVKPYFSTEAST